MTSYFQVCHELWEESLSRARPQSMQQHAFFKQNGADQRHQINQNDTQIAQEQSARNLMTGYAEHHE